MLIRTRNFELEITRVSVYLRLARWDHYVGPF